MTPRCSLTVQTSLHDKKSIILSQLLFINDNNDNSKKKKNIRAADWNVVIDIDCSVFTYIPFKSF